MPLSPGQRISYEAKLNAKIRKDAAVDGKIPLQARIKDTDAIYGVEVINSTRPPLRTRWVEVPTDDGVDRYVEESFPGQSQGWNSQ